MISQRGAVPDFTKLVNKIKNTGDNTMRIDVTIVAGFMAKLYFFLCEVSTMSKTSLIPIQEMPTEVAQNIKYILMDIDDTLTEDGKLGREAYGALWRIKEEGYKVLPITGRPAGWCDMIVREWPVDGVIGENGAFAFYLDEAGHLKQVFHPNAEKPVSGGAIDRARIACLEQVPLCRVSKDQAYRMFDLAIDFAEEEPVLGLDAALKIKEICDSFGLHAKVSSIHVNAWLGDYNKLSMTELFLSERFGYNAKIDAGKVLFFGDSPNDEPMFAHFPCACAVANFSKYLNLVTNYPRFITKQPFGRGFAEAIDVLCEKLKKY